jgi:hypothetical protein
MVSEWNPSVRTDVGQHDATRRNCAACAGENASVGNDRREDRRFAINTNHFTTEARDHVGISAIENVWQPFDTRPELAKLPSSCAADLWRRCGHVDGKSKERVIHNKRQRTTEARECTHQEPSIKLHRASAALLRQRPGSDASMRGTRDAWDARGTRGTHLEWSGNIAPTQRCCTRRLTGAPTNDSGPLG